MIEPPPSERLLGLSRYLTDTPGTGGKLRVRPEDFVVEEVPLAFSPSRGEGKYTIAAVRARNWETNRLMKEIGDRLGVGRNSIFFAGTKDKRAVTTQYVAVRAAEPAVRALRIRDVEVLETFRTDRAPKIGELVGNRFEISIRAFAATTEATAAQARATVDALVAAGGFPNFFGPQRFGTVRPITHEVGRLLVAGDLRGAVWAYCANPIVGEQEDAYVARVALADAVAAAEGDLAREIEAARRFLSEAARGGLPAYMTFERSVLHGLVEHGDYRWALLNLPRNLVTMFVYAYESLLFNRMLAARMDAGLPLAEPVEGDVLFPATEHGTPDKDETIPVTARNLDKCRARCREGKAFVTHLLAGPDVAFAEGAPGEIERRALADAGVAPRDFLVPAMPEAGSGGARREILAPLAQVDLDAGDDEAGGFVRLKFFLAKGAYATCLLREVMKADVSRY